MRTTITVAPDVAAEMKRLQSEEGMGPSEALNTLARRGMRQVALTEHPTLPKPVALGLRIDVNNIADVLEVLQDA